MKGLVVLVALGCSSLLARVRGSGDIHTPALTAVYQHLASQQLAVNRQAHYEGGGIGTSEIYGVPGTVLSKAAVHAGYRPLHNGGGFGHGIGHGVGYGVGHGVGIGVGHGVGHGLAHGTGHGVGLGIQIHGVGHGLGHAGYGPRQAGYVHSDYSQTHYGIGNAAYGYGGAAL